MEGSKNLYTLPPEIDRSGNTGTPKFQDITHGKLDVVADARYEV